MLAGLALGVFVVARHGVSGIRGILMAAGAAVALAAAGAAIGKIAGMGIARMRAVKRCGGDHGVLR